MSARLIISSLFTALVASQFSVQAQNWMKIPAAPGGEGVFFTSADIGYVAGGGPYLGGRDTIFKTVDGGARWTSHPISNCVIRLYFSSPDIGYAGGGGCPGGDSSHIFKSADGGNTWSGQYITRSQVRSIYFYENGIGYAVGDGWGGDSLIFKTTDGGVIWLRQSAGIRITLETVHCTSVNTCYAVGGGYVLKTTDGGANWGRFALGGSLNSVFFPTIDTGYIVGHRIEAVFGTLRSYIFKTTNGGNTWSISHSGPVGVGNETLTSIYCVSSDICYAVGGSGGSIITGSDNLVFTLDGGNTWTRQKLGQGEWLRTVHFPTPTVGYIVGDSGVWKMESANPVLPSQSFSVRFEVTARRLLYHLPVSSKVKILLFDLGGRQSLRLFDGSQPSGEHALALPDAPGLRFIDFRVGEKRRVVMVPPR